MVAVNRSTDHNKPHSLPMRHHGPRSSNRGVPYTSLLFCFISGCLCFYVGVLWGMHMSSFPTTNNSTAEQSPVTSRLAHELQKFTTENTCDNGFSDSISKFASGAARTNRVEFAQNFDTGVPLDKSQRGNQDVLVLYNKAALPHQAKDGSVVPLLNTKEATDSCDNLHVILTDYNPKRKQCIAIMGQYEAFHIQKFMRLPEEGPLDSKLPLRLVNRGAQQGGGKSTRPPTRELTRQYWDILQTYLSTLDSVLEKLKPLAQKVAVQNTIVVMVCNHGQSELLMNFACAARSRGLDTSHVLVFATDVETKELAEGIGLTAFYDETNFARMPSGAARFYLDRNFAAMMMAKVFCVQMITMLGYNVLFQDVDMVWYRNPLEYFHDEQKSGDFDIYFQDDGNHALYYAPYSANTGMYYIRLNDRTQYFMNSFLLAGDLILSTKSHQIALIALLNEHASMYGMRVKIMSRDTDEFPGGFHYHRRKPYMKDMISNKVDPYLFHMSWTKNKDNKMLFMRQMGMWFLDDKCIATTADKIGGGGDLASTCCMAEAKVTCHYRDKPSKIPCKSSPPIDNGHGSWW